MERDPLLDPALAGDPRLARRARVQGECRNRIRAEIDLPAQVNLQGAALTGLLSYEEAELFRAGQEWILDMLRSARARAADPGRCGEWPSPPEGLAALAKRF
ncbi:hypothetical protein SAMN06297129_1143 [Pseudooceanicola antarcticus]|uniref:Uncharacterized protein n=2 Tax=Pseudooceanicola antarcticus TaxID=1247613 RepID=A0A285IK14_9RHOB|nr:hypothetical protein CVM39_11120 [Pseudooceanicola antarcticus]SNY47311.1 hypothetical protein SAMN06297129_1143 [Pseudooceanicola antarcticus]